MPTDLIAALVQAQQQRAGRRLNHSNAEPHSTPAPVVKLKASNAFTDTIELADQAAAVSKRIALFEQQKKSASYVSFQPSATGLDVGCKWANI